MMRDWILLGLRTLAPLLMYAFLGITFYQLRADRRKADTPAATLVRLGASDFTWALGPHNTLGRDTSNAIMLDDGFVSAQHAAISYKDGCWWIEDFNSTNGTLVNDKRIKALTPLNEADIISLGNAQLRLRSV